MPGAAAADPRLRLALAWLAGFTLIDASIVSLALPDIGTDFDRTVGELAWVGTSFLLTLAATLLAAGRLNDRYGARLVLAVGGVGFLVMTLACGLAPTYELLIAARLGQGVAGGILYTVSLAIVVTSFPEDRRASAIGIYFTSGALGAVLGPALGGLLTDMGGWRLVFLAQLPLPAMVAIGAWLLLPSATGRSGRLDVLGLAAASVFLAAATFALLQLSVQGGAVFSAASAIVAASALAAFLAIERRTQDPAVRLEIFGNRRFVIATAAGAAAWFAIMSSVTYAALYLQLGRGLSAADAGFILLTGPLVGLLFFPFAGRFVHAIGVDTGTRIGLVILAAAAIGMVTWGATTPLWLVVLVQILNGAGISITLVASASDAMAQFTPQEAGTGSALFNSLRQLGAAMGVAVPAIAFELVAAGGRGPSDALGGSTAAFVVRLLVLLAPLLLALRARRATAAPAEAA